MSVFSMVTACLARHVFDSIPGKTEDYLRKLHDETGVEYTCSPGNICLIQGQWEGVKQVHALLEALDITSKRLESAPADVCCVNVSCDDTSPASGPEEVCYSEKIVCSGNIILPKQDERSSNINNSINFAEESVRRWQTKHQKDKADAQKLNYYIYSPAEKVTACPLQKSMVGKGGDELLKNCMVFKVPGTTFHGLSDGKDDIKVIREPDHMQKSPEARHRLKTIAGEIDTIVNSEPNVDGFNEVEEQPESAVENAPVIDSSCVEDDSKEKQKEKITKNIDDMGDDACDSTDKVPVVRQKSYHRKKNRSKPKCLSMVEDTIQDSEPLVKDASKPAFTSKVTPKHKKNHLKKAVKVRQKGKQRTVRQKRKCDGAVELIEHENDSLKCHLCGYLTFDQRNLTQHVQRAHHERKFKCDSCGRCYALEKDLAVHLKTHNERYVCNTCGRVYKQEFVLKKHMLTHREDFIKPVFKCEECDRTFSTRYTLMNHTLTVHHGKTNSFVCPTCGKGFTQKHSLIEHQNVHLGVKPFTCSVCKMSFTFSSSLRQHRVKHESVKKYKCLECGKDFAHRNSLRLHKVIHLKERPFACQFCGRTFTQKQALQRHERIHRGEKPYVCEICGRSFTENSTLRRHAQTHSKSSSPNVSLQRITEFKHTSGVPATELSLNTASMPITTSVINPPLSTVHASSLTAFLPPTSRISTAPSSNNIQVTHHQHSHLQPHHVAIPTQHMITHHVTQHHPHHSEPYGSHHAHISNSSYANIYEDPAIMIPMLMNTEESMPVSHF